MSASAAAASSSNVVSTPADSSMPLYLPALPPFVLNASSPALQSAIVEILNRIFPDYVPGMRESAMPCLCRFANALGHALLLGAELHDGAVRFWEPPGYDLSDLRAQVVAQLKFHADAPVLEISTAKRWLAENRALRSAGSASASSFSVVSSAPSLDLSDAALASMCALVQLLLAELLEAACEACLQRDARILSRVDVMRVVSGEDDMGMLCSWLGAPFGDTRSAEERGGAEPTFSIIAEELLREQFAGNAANSERLASRCWFNDSVKVAAYSQQYACGELLPGDETLYREYGVRLQRLWGCTSTPFALHGGSTVLMSFELMDEHGHMHPYIFEQRAELTESVIIDALRGEVALRYIPGLEEEGDKLEQVGWLGRELMQRIKASHAWAKRTFGDATTVSASTSSSEGAAIDGEEDEQEDDDDDADADKEMSAEQRQRKYQREARHEEMLQFLRCYLSAAMSRMGRTQWSPQMFAAHQPLRVRAHCTAALVDRASQSAGLPTLPSVLLELIGEYEPAVLPFIEADEILATAEDRAARELFVSSCAWEAPQRVLRAGMSPQPLSVYEEYEHQSDDEEEDPEATEGAADMAADVPAGDEAEAGADAGQQ